MKIARITNDGTLKIKGELIETSGNDVQIKLNPNGNLEILGELVKKVVPLPPEDEIWI